MDLEQLVEHFDHYDFELCQDPHPGYRYLREHCPVAHSDRHGGFWVVTRYDDLRRVMADPTTYSSRTLTIPDQEAGVRFPVAQTDPPDHAEWRGIVQAWFSAARMAKLEPAIRTRTNDLIDEFVERGTADLAVELGYRLPAEVIAEIMGVPSEDAPFFEDCANRLSSTNVEDPEGARAAFGALFEYYGKLIDQRRRVPGDDIPTVLANATIGGRPLDELELGCFCILLQFAGFDTTAGFMGNLLWHLAEHPDHRARLLEDPSTIPQAVEEYLRVFAPASPGRQVMADTQLGDRELEAGDRLVLLIPSANRDDAQFDHPDEVDFDRGKVQNLTFGHGIHRCVGMHLARLEARVMLEELLPRIPHFGVTPGEKPRCAVGQNWGVRSLPVTFSPGARLGAGV